MTHDKFLIRRANNSDCKSVWLWKNDPVAVRNSISKEKVSWETHKKWFSNAIINQNISILIALVENNRAGMVRLDYDSSNHTETVSINLSPNFRGKGLSFKILSHSLKNARASRIIAFVNKDNPASLRIFRKANFEIVETELNFFKLQRNI